MSECIFESEILSMIRNSKDPAKAMEIVMETIRQFLAAMSQNSKKSG